jgi:ribonucleoside-diphosphate reductase beta chain|tara:strand:+ start:916 stop:1902 length:987 start_codon:yes stop_codon:yes gene_type:complete
MKKSHNIFEARANILPYEYPQLLEYKDAIRHSYWIDTEFNFTEDIQDFKINLSKQERDVIKKTMLSIAQIEVSVKTFWADMYKRMPIAEVGDVGMTFAESEVRHKDAYARLIRILGLEKEFETVVDVPAIAGRIKYLTKYLDGTRSRDNKMYAKSVLLFSLFIEHVSLFSQFLIMMSFNKDKNMLKGISNVVEATSKEEDIHGNFGAEIINIIRKENPEWFDEDFKNLVYSACEKAYKAECKVLDWIFESGELTFLSKDTIKEFIKNRFNNSLMKIGYKPLFDIDKSLLTETKWFDIEITATKEGDFFYKKSIDYNKKSKSITEDDLF